MAKVPVRVAVLSDIPKLLEMVKERVGHRVVSCTSFDASSLNTPAHPEIILADPSKLEPYLDTIGSNGGSAGTKWVALTWAGVERTITALRVDSHSPVTSPTSSSASGNSDSSSSGAMSSSSAATSSPQWRLTRFAGYFGPAMAEYVLGHVISRERGFADYAAAQAQHKWAPRPGYRTLNELSIGVLGLGEIGKRVATACAAMGMSVAGLVRTVPPEHKKLQGVEYYRTDQLAELLARSDYICNVLPSTPASRGLLGGGILAHCRKGACLINVGRGDIVAESDLVAALEAGHLAGAVLDVFEKEPLRESSPLWSMPGVVITPHQAALSFPAQVADHFARNLDRFAVDPASLEHQVDVTQGY